MPFRRFQARRQRERAAHSLYSAIIVQSRLPDFYLRLGVPDTLDGRFDMIVLHAFLVMHRLKVAGGDEDTRLLSQAVFDLMFDDMDENLREMGVGDMSIGKKVKQMARAFYGRVAAYEDGLAGGPGALEAALGRNLYGTATPAADPAAVAGMAVYLRRQAAGLAGQGTAALMDGHVGFLAPETADGA
jgi:cytochrome b pre-mRNA-processing protein 3